MLNVCLCGANDHEPHDATCPYPCYRRDDYAVRLWNQKREHKVIGMMAKALGARVNGESA